MTYETEDSFAVEESPTMRNLSLTDSHAQPLPLTIPGGNRRHSLLQLSHQRRFLRPAEVKLKPNIKEESI